MLNQRVMQSSAPITLDDLLRRVQMSRAAVSNNNAVRDPQYAHQANNPVAIANANEDAYFNNSLKRRVQSRGQQLGGRFVEKWTAVVLHALSDLIDTRMHDNPEESYTAFLFSAGTLEMCRRLIDEAGGMAVALASPNQDHDDIAQEAADVLYHMMICLASTNISVEKVIDQLAVRIRNSGAPIEFNRVLDRLAKEQEEQEQQEQQEQQEEQEEQEQQEQQEEQEQEEQEQQEQQEEEEEEQEEQSYAVLSSGRSQIKQLRSKGRVALAKKRVSAKKKQKSPLLAKKSQVKVKLKASSRQATSLAKGGGCKSTGGGCGSKGGRSAMVKLVSSNPQ
jgi:phosphoribosyl-ATP pyrophosphohydrolase